MVILTVMIAPVMVAVFCDGLRAVPRGWLEASLGLGINKWRTVWKIGVRTARPALVAGTVLATARALGEAVMVAMVCGVVSFAPNPADGWIFFVEPTRPLASTHHLLHRRPVVAADAPHAVRDCRGAVAVGSVAVLRRLGR